MKYMLALGVVPSTLRVVAVITPLNPALLRERQAMVNTYTPQPNSGKVSPVTHLRPPYHMTTYSPLSFPAAIPSSFIGASPSSSAVLLGLMANRSEDVQNRRAPANIRHKLHSQGLQLLMV